MAKRTMSEILSEQLVGRPVRVVWNDSTQHMLQWLPTEAVPNLEMAIIATVGVLVQLTDERVVLASDRDTHDHVQNVTVIPRACVMRLDRLSDAQEAVEELCE